MSQALTPQGLYNQSVWRGVIIIPAFVVKHDQGTAMIIALPLSTTSSPILSVTIRANDDNTNPIRVGGSGVTAANGYLLGPGETVTLAVADLILAWVVTESGTEGYSYIAMAASAQTFVAI